jgi:hypothetical protein
MGSRADLSGAECRSHAASDLELAMRPSRGERRCPLPFPSFSERVKSVRRSRSAACAWSTTVAEAGAVSAASRLNGLLGAHAIDVLHWTQTGSKDPLGAIPFVDDEHAGPEADIWYDNIRRARAPIGCGGMAGPVFSPTASSNAGTTTIRSTASNASTNVTDCESRSRRCAMA